MRIRFILFLLLSKCIVSNAQIQLDSISDAQLMGKLSTLSKTRAVESIYLQTDRDIYENDQDIWFKAYILDNQLLSVSHISEVLFLQLINEDDRAVILEEKYEISNGIAQGHLYLPNTLEEGNYVLVGHTVNSMLDGTKEIQSLKPIQIKESVIPVIIADVEFDKELYAKDDEINLRVNLFSRSRTPLQGAVVKATLLDINQKKIAKARMISNEEGEADISFVPKTTYKINTIETTINHKGKTATYTYVVPVLNSDDIQFGLYPEGGELIAGFKNNVAFKAVNRFGAPQSVKGILYSDNEEVLSFQSAHDGMGKFTFAPSTEHNYHIKLTEPKTDSIFALPKIVPEGVVLQLKNYTKKYITFKIENTTTLSKEKIYIRAQMRGMTYWMAMGALSLKETYFKIPLSEIPQGIVEVTVFDKTYKPIAERLVYANLDRRLYIQPLTSVLKTYGKKKKVSLEYQIKDENNRPVTAHLGLSIYSHLYRDETTKNTIQTYGYLSSVLKGKIHNPDFYFNDKNKNRQESLDILLLTQGWRNYQWNENHLKKNTVFHAENRMTEDIIGRIYFKNKKGILEETGETEVHVISSHTVKSIKSNTIGTINLSKEFLKLQEGHSLLVKPNGDNLIVKMVSHFEKINKSIASRTFPLRSKVMPINAETKTKFSGAFSFDGLNFLEEVEITGHTKHKRDHPFKTLFPFTSSNFDYVCVQYGILNCTNHRSGLKPIEGQIYKLNDGREIRYEAPPEANDTERAEFGIVKGYYPKKEFYSPNYDKREDAVFPDYRKTLLWEPNLIPNEKGEISISFYTSDIGSTFIGEFEGIGGQGLLGYKTFEFRVE